MSQSYFKPLLKLLNCLNHGRFAILALFAVCSFMGTAPSFANSMEDGDIQPWYWTKSNCQNCPIFFEAKHPDLQTKKVQAFIEALEDSKFEIVKLYNSDPQEYNLLAHMAIGILGRESNFFKSWRYFAKEEMQWGVSIVKTLRTFLDSDRKATQNSRGPTQIKVIPELIAEHYNLVPSDLENPANAARATMGFLIEALRELKQRAKNNNLEFITRATYSDYLPYIYFGASRELINRTATPEKNLYVRTMKAYMSWVQIHELHPK